MIYHKRLSQKSGFTIIEILVVIAIVGVLATIVIMGYQAYISNVTRSQIATNAESYDKTLKAYSLEYRSYPKYPSCLPSGTKCCYSTAAVPATVKCGTDSENSWDVNSQADNVTKYINSQAPSMPVVSTFTNCVSGLMSNGPCQPIGNIKMGITYVYNTTGAIYTSSDTTAKGFLIFYIATNMECGKNVMTLSGTNLSFNSSAKYTRSTSDYRECIVGVKNN